MPAEAALMEAALAEAIVIRSRDLPDIVRQLASEHVADHIGVAVAGIDSDTFRAVQRLLAPRPHPGPGLVRVWGGGGYLPARDAAMLNAVAGHIDDFDDDEAELSLSHPTVTVLSAAAAAAELVPVSGQRLIEAYVGGVEFLMRIGPLMNPRHYTSGFHATATLGAMAAAVAAGLVFGLDAGRMRHALGIAASLSSGLRSNFGSDTKAIQTGNATRSGVMAAEFARDGLTSTPGSLFGPQGFVAVFGGAVGETDLGATFGRPWLFDRPGITIKAYPCCTCTHTSLDSLFALVAEGHIAADTVSRIEVDVDEATPRILIHDGAATALEGKFSMPYCLAVGLLRGRLGLAEFDDTIALDPQVRALMASITMVPDPALPKTDGGISLATRLRVTLSDGSVIERYTQQPSGSRNRRLDRDRLLTKFLANAAGALPAAPAVFDQLLAIASAPDAARAFDVLCAGAQQTARAS